MPAGEPNFGDDTTLSCNTGTAHAYVAIADLETLTPPGGEVKSVERKPLSNPGFVVREPSPRKDYGTVPFSYELTDDTFIALEALLGDKKHGDGTDVQWRVDHPDGLRQAFKGFLRSNKPQQVQGEQISMAQGELVVTSAVTVSDEDP